jgi:hypothetical protein
MSIVNTSPVSELCIAAALLATLCLPLGASAAGDARPDSDLVTDCVKEVASRDFEGVAVDHLLVSSSEVRRGATEDVVRVAVASGEGRSARATCKFRGGKLFDVLR